MKHLFLIAALLSGTPALAHEAPSAEAKKHADAPASFASPPPLGTWARCPVSGDIFQIAKETQFAEYHGRVYAFCCDDCKPDFVKNPAKYAASKASKS